MDALKNCDKICFTVYGNETIKEETWAPYTVSSNCEIAESNFPEVNMIKIQELRKQDYKKARQFAIQGMHLYWYVSDRIKRKCR